MELAPQQRVDAVTVGSALPGVSLRSVTMTKGRFVTDLVSSIPEAAPLVAEHLDDQEGELLLHLLVADFRRFLLDAWQRRDEDVLRRGLALLDVALTTGDEYVENAVAVSFVEDVGWWDSDVQPFIATWPAGLTAEVERLRAQGG